MWMCRTEQLKLHTRAGKVKTLGALLCVAGALTTSLYKGHEFHIGHQHVGAHTVAEPTNAYWTRGTFLLVGSCLSYSTWFIVQVRVNAQIHSHITFSLFSFFFCELIVLMI